jgi:hypothetical protein
LEGERGEDGRNGLQRGVAMDGEAEDVIADTVSHIIKDLICSKFVVQIWYSIC